MKKINVEVSDSSYPVFAGRGIIHHLKPQLKKYGRFKNFFIVVDRNVAKYHLKKMNSSQFLMSTSVGGEFFLKKMKKSLTCHIVVV